MEAIGCVSQMADAEVEVDGVLPYHEPLQAQSSLKVVNWALSREVKWPLNSIVMLQLFRDGISLQIGAFCGKFLSLIASSSVS